MKTTFNQCSLPQFQQLDPAQFEPKIRELLARNKRKLNELLAAPQPFTWENFMQPIEDMSDELSNTWSPISHLHAVKNQKSCGKYTIDTLPLMTEYGTELAQNENYFRAVCIHRGKRRFRQPEFCAA